MCVRYMVGSDVPISLPSYAVSLTPQAQPVHYCLHGTLAMLFAFCINWQIADSTSMHTLQHNLLESRFRCAQRSKDLSLKHICLVH